jgi:TPR repeat protein|mmetsp:Transcript_70313/g.156605  ORF Transcript_70313/g.156605 Transcript_70313/m.156605 type:complete len:82 (+) Transcript_70313:57-302(+)
MAAEKGVPGSMYLLAECLFEGVGTKRDIPSALGWFAAAGELGHRGARSRILVALGQEDTDNSVELRNYQAVAGRRHSAWQV